MTISYSPDQETQDALTHRVNEFNEKTGSKLSVPDFILQEVVTTYGEQLKRQKYESTVARIGVLFSDKPYEERTALTAMLETQTQAK